jgi:hypothetical protein
VQQAVPVLPDDGVTLILNGDVPLIQADTLRSLLAQCGGKRLALLSVDMPDPTGYGRIVRQGDAGAGDRRAQGRESGAAPDPGNLYRRAGGARRRAEALAGWPAQRQRARASTT